MHHPHMTFILTLVAVGPLFALVGMTSGGLWRGVGVAAAGAVVAIAAARSWRFSRTERDIHTVLRWRMMAATGTVAVAAVVLTVSALIWLVIQLLR